MTDVGLGRDLAALLAASGWAEGALRIFPLVGGRNNRVYRVETPDRVLVAKRYFRHSTDDRDRLSAEYSFLQYAQRIGVQCVPTAVARSDRAGLALYEFVEGRTLTQDEVCAEHIEQARDFLVALNDHDSRPLAAHLPPASDARFSIGDHLELVQQRVDALAHVSATTEVEAQAMALASQMGRQWAALREGVLRAVRREGLDPSAALEQEDRCVSPSDFGFHNALATPGGMVTFLDFEYAGWDDPAKMVSDFFSQPAVPVPIEHYDRFLASALSFSPNAEMLAVRTRILMPVFRMKWCCILMNEFLPQVLRRRRFADPSTDNGTRERAQLEKARRLLSIIRVSCQEHADGLH